MTQTTCQFHTSGCSLSMPCVKCRAASSHRSNQLTRPRFQSKRGPISGRR